ncbi:MAG: hypothetical protein ACJASU_001444 [Cognaticolwellia sp.]|jgi:hypothetical protein
MASLRDLEHRLLLIKHSKDLSPIKFEEAYYSELKIVQ